MDFILLNYIIKNNCVKFIHFKIYLSNMSKTARNKLNSFKEKAILIFCVLTKKFGYTLSEVRDIYTNDKLWSVHYIYDNFSENLKIIIKQEPCYTDYGFTFEIQNTKNNESNIICNWPHEKQDYDLNSLQFIANTIFESNAAVHLISGKNWQLINGVLLQF